MSKLWGGMFGGGLDPHFEAFNRSLAFDQRMVLQDLQGSVAWARALCHANVLDADEATQLATALEEMATELSDEESSLCQTLRTSDAEDVHSFVESELYERVGDLAKKLHTGRSRNDQVATDLKLWMHEAIDVLSEGLVGLQLALVNLAEKHADLPIPGYTHLQRAQPITVGHHALAYVEMLRRDLLRVSDADERMDACPLGSGALAGTAFPIDRMVLAEELGFDGPTRNSLDAVSDRDHVCEVVFACSMIMVHLSRLAEDWIFFASQDAGYLSFGDAVATGSSLMPQKKNPDAMELLRGKAGRVAGSLQSLLMTLKGLPLAYNKDMQEDKEALFDAMDTTTACLRVATTAVQHAEFDVDQCQAQSSRGYLNATDLADLLVASGVPFRTAHERAGQTVRRALEYGVEIEDLPNADLSELVPELVSESGASLHERLSVTAVLDRRNSIGGTAPARVREEVASWQRRLRIDDDK